VGITGPPGAGKSSLLDGLLRAYRARDLRLGVLAVDPSSPFTGGALLGDRIRMHEASRDAGVFIRSLGSRGSLGGLSARTEAVADLLDAFGHERIFIETVGVGQSELDIVENCYSTVVVLTPESGDGIQTMKAGLMEIGDLFVVNKADRDGAERLAGELEATLSARGPREGWLPPVLRTVASSGEGLESLSDGIEEHRAFLEREGRLALRRRDAVLRRARAAVDAAVGAALWGDGQRMRAVETGVAKLLDGRIGFDALVAAALPADLSCLDAAPDGAGEATHD
jgi:LAO/AO transport system kinase